MEVISNVDKFTASALLYGLDNSNIDYFRNKYNILKNDINYESPYINHHIGILNNIEYRVSDNYIRDIKDRLYKQDMYGNDDTNIYYYKDPYDANDISRRYIMSNPYIYNMYRRGLIEGYGYKYVDDEVERMNMYASVMNGEIADDNTITTYYGYDLIDINKDDKEIVKQLWLRCKELMKKDIDPTRL